MLLCAMVTSFVLGLFFFILLIIRIQIGTVTSDDTLHMIAVGIGNIIHYRTEK